MQTDDGKEFYDREVQAWFKHNGWHHFSTKGDSKASMVEQWHRTLKERMFRYFTAHNTLKYWDVLPQLVLTYNSTRHRSIGISLLEVTPTNEALVWQHLYGIRMQSSISKTIEPKCKVADKARLNKKNTVRLKKAICQVGQRRFFWSLMYTVFHHPLHINRASGMEHQLKVRSKSRTCKK